MLTDRLVIFDTTLRDGEQSPGCSMFIDEKIKMARQLESLGVDVVEAGFPIASEGDYEAVRAVAAECNKTCIAALARANDADVIRAAEALRPAAKKRIHTFIATSDIHLEYKLKKSREDVLEMTHRAVSLAASLADEVEFSAEDATRSESDFLFRVLETAADAGATIINIPDTVGYCLPDDFAAIVAGVAERFGGGAITVSVHCHNDLGLAVANSLAAIAAGARQVECTINGIGERAGNAALEEIVMAITVRGDKFGLSHGIDTRQLYPTSQLLSSMIAFGVQPNKAIVGANAFAHEAGIHQHGVLSNPLCYEIMTPESVGAPKSDIVLGKHSGRHALIARFAELGRPLQGDEVDAVYAKFVRLADRKKKIYDQDLLSLTADSIQSVKAA
jgi:2-isopropylmalate synthase